MSSVGGLREEKEDWDGPIFAIILIVQFAFTLITRRFGDSEATLYTGYLSPNATHEYTRKRYLHPRHSPPNPHPNLALCLLSTLAGLAAEHADDQGTRIESDCHLRQFSLKALADLLGSLASRFLPRWGITIRPKSEGFEFLPPQEEPPGEAAPPAVPGQPPQGKSDPTPL